MTKVSWLQRQTEAMWQATAQARAGRTEAFLRLDGMARWNPPSDRLKRAALRNALSAMAGDKVTRRAEAAQRKR